MLKSFAIGIVAARHPDARRLRRTHGAAQTKDIVDTAVAAGSFKTLAQGARRPPDLVDTLKGAGPFTVFAPTDEAFAKLPAGTLETLLKPENKAKLRRILTYHVVPGKADGGRRREDAVGQGGQRRHDHACQAHGGTVTRGQRARHQDRHRRQQRRHPRDRRGDPAEGQVGPAWMHPSCSPARRDTSAAAFFDAFEEGGRAVRCLARQPGEVGRHAAHDHRVVQGDCLDEASLDRALAGVQRRLLPGALDGRAGSQFADVDRRAAENFGRAAARAGVRRIIYLGGLADDAVVAFGASQEPRRDRETPSRQRRAR